MWYQIKFIKNSSLTLAVFWNKTEQTNNCIIQGHICHLENVNYENVISYLSKLTATKFRIDAIPESISTYDESLHIKPPASQVITKYFSVSWGTQITNNNRSAIAKLTKKGIVGDLILPFFTHVIIIIKFPVMPIKNVNVCVMIIGRNAFKSKMQIKTNHNNT